MIDVVQLHRVSRCLELHIIRLRKSTALHFTRKYFPSKLARSVLLFDSQPLPDLVTRATGANMLKPVTTGLLSRIGDDLDRVRVLELPRQSRLPAVDPRAARVQPDFSVHRERKVDRSCALRQLDHIASRREDEDLVLI